MAAINDMDVDMDIDLDVDPEIAALEAEAMKIEARATAAAAANNAADSNGDMIHTESSTSDPAPTKVHIRGLDNLTTGNIKEFAGQYYSLDFFQRVEWIDDTSANLIYENSEAAAEALVALSDLPDGSADQMDPLEMRKAKPLPSNSEAELYIRQATISDVKAPRAHERSRFYLMNPEHDPRERKRQYDDRRGGQRRGDRHRSEEAPKPFDVNMYDDDAGDTTEPRYDDEDRRRGARSMKPRGGGGDLFAGKNTGRLRDRSASPVRDGDGRFGFDQDQPERKPARRRSVSPAPRKRHLLPSARSNNQPKELLPAKGKTFGLDTPLTSSHSPKRSRELFPHKTAHSNHRRSDALDGGETANLRRSLADRITATPASSEGFSIKGSAQDNVPGFSIRGASREINPLVKELFPSKVGNGTQNDLFAGKMKGRNAPRRRAEDMM